MVRIMVTDIKRQCRFRTVTLVRPYCPRVRWTGVSKVFVSLYWERGVESQ